MLIKYKARNEKQYSRQKKIFDAILKKVRTLCPEEEYFFQDIVTRIVDGHLFHNPRTENDMPEIENFEFFKFSKEEKEAFTDILKETKRRTESGQLKEVVDPHSGLEYFFKEMIT